MALSLDIDLANGLPVVTDAYLRVEGAKVHYKENGVRTAACGLHVYASAEHVGLPLRPPEYHQFTYNGGDIDEEAYVYLKTLPAYSDAADV